MTTLRLSVAALLAAPFIVATPASAQMYCSDRASIIEQLENRYGETRQSMGLQQGRGLVEVWASEETGTWSIVVTSPQGVTCLMAAGEAFQEDTVTKTSDTPA